MLKILVISIIGTIVLNAQVIETSKKIEIPITKIEDCPSAKKYFKNENEFSICNTEYFGKGFKISHLNITNNVNDKFSYERIVNCKNKNKGYRLVTQSIITGNKIINGFKSSIYGCIKNKVTLFLEFKNEKFNKHHIKD